MRSLRTAIVSVVVLILLSTWALGQDSNAQASSQNQQVPVAGPPGNASSFGDVIRLVVERERFFNQQIRQMHPLIETYIQSLKKTDEMGATTPISDRYFLGRLDLINGSEDRFESRRSGKSHVLGKLNLAHALNELSGVRFLPSGFAQMVLVDEDFQRQYYDFSYVRREFLGEIRCLVIDVQPKQATDDGRFVGRIWVEDQDYNIVRFNGTYVSHSDRKLYLHFDSWRMNMKAGQWLPAYVYSEESGDRSHMGQNLHFKAQTRLWGYDLQKISNNDQFTEIVVDASPSVHDQSEAVQDASPVQSVRLWEREAEDNSIERLQKIGLVAPEGEVDRVMQTVVSNLIVTNNLNIDPEVRCRVLLTTPLESFTIGHTIVISRGLLDVLPDEASLAMVLAHELSHIALGHGLDTKLAFNDRMLFPDQQTFERLDFARDSAQEQAADAKAMELLSNSPYKDKLGNAGLFLKALQAHAPQLKNLIRPHLGSSVASGNSVRMSALLSSAPPLELKKTDQIAALPLGGRIRLDPWSDRIEMAKGKPVALLVPREKLAFEITPFFPYLSRISNVGPDKVALTSPVK